MIILILFCVVFRTPVLILISQLFCESRNKHILIRLGKNTDLINLTAAPVANTKEHSLFVDALKTSAAKIITRYESGAPVQLFGCS